MLSLQRNKKKQFNSNPSWEKVRRLYILLKYHTSPPLLIKYKGSHIFAGFVPVLTTLCLPRLKIVELF